VRSIVVCLAALALAGCGGPSPEDEVRETVASFGRAVQAREYARICDELLARELLDKLEQAGLPCRFALARGLESVRRPTLEIVSVDVRGESVALVRVRTGAANQPPSMDTFRVVREPTGWRIASLAGGGGAAPAPRRTAPQRPPPRRTTPAPRRTAPQRPPPRRTTPGSRAGPPAPPTTTGAR